jgi:hypothetical protein
MNDEMHGRLSPEELEEFRDVVKKNSEALDQLLDVENEDQTNDG